MANQYTGTGVWELSQGAFPWHHSLLPDEAWNGSVKWNKDEPSGSYVGAECWIAYNESARRVTYSVEIFVAFGSSFMYRVEMPLKLA